MANHGLFKMTQNRHFDHTPLSQILRKDAEGSYRAAARMWFRIFPTFNGLHHSVMTGEPAFNDAFGQPLFVECVVPVGNESSISKDFDMVMMIVPGGIERTEQEYRDLFRQSGFELTTVTPTNSMVSVIEGRPV